MEKLKQNPVVKKLGLNRILLVCILILMFIVFKVVLGSKFPVADSIKSTLNYVYFLGFLSLGVTFVIATGGIDFSIGPVMFCCALISGYCMTAYHVPCALAMVICVLIGFAFGMFNGFMVSYMSVPAFIISMASMNIAKGLASVFTKTQSVSWPQSSDPVNGWFRNIISYKGFPVGDSIKSTLNYVYFLGFLSLGVTFVIATGGIDFSIGPVMFCCALVSGYSMISYGVPCAAAMVICILVGLAFGIFNGWLVSYMSVPPFIVSMASMNIAKGIASVFTKTQSVSWPQASDPANGWFRNITNYNGVPVGLVIFLAMAVICGIVLYNTKPGRYILCLGSNSEAVRLSGVNTRKWRMLAYVICGFLVGIAALFFVATYTTVQPGYGDQYNNEAIAGCVMGGTSMAGGLASIGGTVIGVFIISLLQQGIMAFGLGKGQQMIITGLIVIVAVYADVSARRRKN